MKTWWRPGAPPIFSIYSITQDRSTSPKLILAPSSSIRISVDHDQMPTVVVLGRAKWDHHLLKSHSRAYDCWILNPHGWCFPHIPASELWGINGSYHFNSGLAQIRHSCAARPCLCLRVSRVQRVHAFAPDLAVLSRFFPRSHVLETWSWKLIKLPITWQTKIPYW